VTGYEPVGQGFESLAAHQRGSFPWAESSPQLNAGTVFLHLYNAEYAEKLC